MLTRELQLAAMEKAIADYNLKNPDELEKFKLRRNALVALPTAAGAAARDVIAMTPAQFAVATSMAGLTAALANRQLYRKKILQDMGIETNFLGTYAKPITDSARRTYFDD